MTKTIFLDLETTGLNYNEDEFVSAAIIDNDDNVLLNTLSKPVKKTSWVNAQRVHKISPEDVANKPTNNELKQQIIDICKDNIIVIYNSGFDVDFIGYIRDVAKQIKCCMVMFAEFYGEWNNYHNNYKWQKLDFASEYIGYDLTNAHDALADCRATRAVYNYILACKNKYEVLSAELTNEKYLSITQNIHDSKTDKLYHFYYEADSENEYKYNLVERLEDDEEYNNLLNEMIENGLDIPKYIEEDHELKPLAIFLHKNNPNLNTGYNDDRFSLTTHKEQLTPVIKNVKLKKLGTNKIETVQYDYSTEKEDYNCVYEFINNTELKYFLKYADNFTDY